MKNEFGSDMEEMYLNVCSRPGKPLGPLVVKPDVAQRCKLKWKPPKDGGGCPISHYGIDLFCQDTKIWKTVLKSWYVYCTGLLVKLMLKMLLFDIKNKLLIFRSTILKLRIWRSSPLQEAIFKVQADFSLESLHLTMRDHLSL